jgi:hypothetical protein
MLSRLGKMAACILLLVVFTLVNSPLPVRADGGVIVGYDLWIALKEGQQIAVITIQNKDTTKIDLFISILDKTNESHEVVFFLPLGTKTTNFYAVEQNLSTFDRDTTRGLDSILRSSADRKKQAIQALFSGTLLNNGALLIPLWAPMLLSGCAAAEPKPEATFQTESSQISIYGIDENTNLEALISTTGLHSSVKETLSRLRGQQIAVVKIQTQPQDSGSTGTGREPSEPGIHLSWYTSFVPTKSGATYSYPLGTGASWSKPIELTRVYIVAPTGMDFDVTYPALGSKQSGYDYIKGARIADYYQVPAYAVDEARGSFGRVWRATYTQSNPSEDIVIVARPQTTLGRLRASIEESAIELALGFALIAGLAIWILAWHFLMPRFLGEGPEHNPRLRWYYSLIYPGLNAVLMVFPGSVLYLFFLLGLTIPSLAILFVVLGGASIGVFVLVHTDARYLSVSREKAIGAFVLVSLASSGAYLLLAFTFAKLTGII